MKKITLIIAMILMFSLNVSVNAIDNANTVDDVVTVESDNTERTTKTNGQTVFNESKSIDTKYLCDYKKWQEDYEYEVECWLGIQTNPALEYLGYERYGIAPERTEEWWDEWIEGMLTEGLIEQEWYNEMVEKGYIIEVD